MLIISKTKDYYDYLTGINGIDRKIVLDRRNYKNFKFILNEDNIRFCNNSFMYKDQQLFVVEIGTTQYLFHATLNNNELIKKFDLGTQLFNRITSKYKYCEYINGKWNVCATNLYLLFNDILKSGKKLEDITINDLANYGYGYVNGIFLHYYGKSIPAQEAYDNIYNFLIAQKNEAKECEMTDVQKLLSKGFDKRTSFRKM